MSNRRTVPKREPDGKRFVGHRGHYITRKTDGRGEWGWVCDSCPRPVVERAAPPDPKETQ